MYLQRALLYPQLDKVQEMRQHLEARVRLAQSQGRKVGLSQQLFSPDGVVFVLTVRYNDLAELEQTRQRQSTDSSFQEFVAKAVSLSRLPAKNELLETLVPLPS